MRRKIQSSARRRTERTYTDYLVLDDEKSLDHRISIGQEKFRSEMATGRFGVFGSEEVSNKLRGGGAKKADSWPEARPGHTPTQVCWFDQYQNYHSSRHCVHWHQLLAPSSGFSRHIYSASIFRTRDFRLDSSVGGVFQPGSAHQAKLIVEVSRRVIE